MLNAKEAWLVRLSIQAFQRGSFATFGKEPRYMTIYLTELSPESSPIIEQTCFPKDANPPSPFLQLSSLANQADVMGDRTQPRCTPVSGAAESERLSGNQRWRRRNG